MAKKQTFQDKTKGKGESSNCPVCDQPLQYVKQVKAVKTDVGAWKFRSQNAAVCKCNEKEIYG
jgi:hypothetical protein